MDDLKIIVKADSGTEFVFLPLREPLADEDIAHVGDHAEPNSPMRCNVFKRATFGETKRNFSAAARPDLLETLRKLGLAPLDENWNALATEDADFREQVFNCVRMIAAIDYFYFRRDLETVSIKTAMERYLQPIVAAVLALRPIREIEKRFYHLDNLEYEIHFCPSYREVIISKKPAPGILGWFQKKSTRGYSIANRPNAILLASITLPMTSERKQAE